jgi:predicted AlkP superfamily phosphohydrolase/phosphomutase
LAEELKEVMGGYKVYGSRSKENLDRSIAGMYETIPMRIKAASYLWNKYELNLMILVFMETDVIQHKTWKYMDVAHPQYDPHGAKKYGNAILGVYKCIDQHLSLLLDQLDEETALIIMSDHGAGPVDKWLNLNNWLVREGFMCLKSEFFSQARYLLFRAGITPNNAYRIAAKLNIGLVDRVADQTKRKASIMKASPLMKVFLSFNDIDWHKTRAYTLGGNLTGIWVNLKGREPEGCVLPGSEYENLRDELITRLQTLRDPQTNLPIATNIYRREEIYHGPYLDRAPDVVFETRNEQYVGFGIQEFVTNVIAEPSPVFNGCHRRAGMVALYGKPFLEGVYLKDHDITDLAPTILYLLGQNIPEDMDGNVMLDAFNPEIRLSYPICKSGTSWKPSIDDESNYTEEEEKAVAEQLRNLGYL